MGKAAGVPDSDRLTLRTQEDDEDVTSKRTITDVANFGQQLTPS